MDEPAIEEVAAAAERDARPDPAVLERALAALRPVPGASPAARLARLAPALARLADPRGDVRRHLVRTLPEVTSFHPRMVEVGLELQCRRLAPEALEAMLRRPHPRLSRARVPTAIVHAGNVPALAALDLAVAALAGDPVAVKCATREPVTGPLTATLLSRTAGGPCAAAFGWARDDARLEMLLAFGDRLLLYGSDRAIAAIDARWRAARTRVRTGERIAFAHRASAAWAPVGGFPLPELARRLATDVALWDQEGCLSPHVVFTDAALDAEALGAALAEALAALAVTLPPGPRTLADRAAVRAWLSRFEAAIAAGAGARTRIWRGAGGGYTVVLDAAEPLGPSPLGRSIRVMPIEGAGEMLERLARWPLQALAVGDDPRRHRALVEPLARLGATRLCAAGRLQAPGPHWVGEEPDARGDVPFAFEPETEALWSETGAPRT